MALVKSNRNRWPFGYGLIDFLEHKNRFDNDFFLLGKSVPFMNIKEHEKNFDIELSSPGFEKNDFEMTLNVDILDVSADKTTAQEEKENEYTRKEFNYRSFRRSLQIPKT